MRKNSKKLTLDKTTIRSLTDGAAATGAGTIQTAGTVCHPTGLVCKPTLVLCVVTEQMSICYAC